MEKLKQINNLIMFLLELLMPLSLGYWGFSLTNDIALKFLYGFGAAILAGVLWGVYVAPRSSRRLKMPYRAYFSLTLFWISSFLLYQAGLKSYAIAFGVASFTAMMLAMTLEK